MLDDEQRKARLELLRQEAIFHRNSVCAEYLALIALNSRAGGGRAWIEEQLDMEEDDDDFRPY